MVQVSKQSFCGAYVVSGTRGARCTRSGIFFQRIDRIGARCAQSGIFFSWVNFFCQDGSNEVSHATKNSIKTYQLQSENRFMVSVFKPFTDPSGRRWAKIRNIGKPYKIFFVLSVSRSHCTTRGLRTCFTM